jgi:hypothetical protein
MSKTILYLIFAISAVSAIASLLSLNVYLILFSIFSSLALFFLYKLWDVFENLIIKKTGVIQMVGEYQFEAERTSAIRKNGGSFSALCAAILKDLPSKEINRENIERIVSSTNAPFRFVIQVEKLNTGKIFDDLRTRRKMKEIQLSKIESKKDKNPSKSVERELELIEDEIKAIGSGSIPLKTSIYLMSFAKSESKFVAEEKALSQVNALAGEFSAVLGAGFEIVSGSSLISILRSDIFCEGEMYA